MKGRTAIVAFLLSGGLIVGSAITFGTRAEPPAPTAGTAVAEGVRLRPRLLLKGTLVPAQLVPVSAGASGLVTDVGVTRGQLVSRGQTLFIVNSDIAKAEATMPDWA